jgi:serralysin
MAEARAYRPLNMQAILSWYGEVPEASPSHIVVTDGVRAAVYEGTFAYNSWGDIAGGTLTGFTHLTYGSVDYTASLSVDAVQAAFLIRGGYIQSLFVAALAGDDTIYGSDGADALYGHKGHDLIAGGSGADRLDGDEGNDFLVGGSGNDLLVGDAGVDTAWTGALRRQSTGYRWRNQEGVKVTQAMCALVASFRNVPPGFSDSRPR